MDTNRDQLCMSPLRLMYGIHTHALKSTRASICRIADHAGINDVYDRFGPVPRLCIDIFGKADQFWQYQVDVHKAISNITLEQLARLFEDASSLRPDDISHKICPLPILHWKGFARRLSSKGPRSLLTHPWSLNMMKAAWNLSHPMFTTCQN